MIYPNPTELHISGYERVIRFEVPELRLKGFIAIHNTLLGPSLGGVRLWDYDNEDAALKDVLRLAEGMTYKAAAAHLPLGGGKAVLIGNQTIKSSSYFEAFGHYISLMNGKYITAEDINTSTEDMNGILKSTPHVVGLSTKSGNPSPWTALGAFRGIEACIAFQWPEKHIASCSFAIQGLGATGQALLHLLIQAGAKRIFAADINQKQLELTKQKYPFLTILNADELLFANVDVLIPCALGGILNEETIPRIQAKIIAGTANNLLKNYEKDSQIILKYGLLLAPDFIINAGGLIHVSKEKTLENEQQTLDRIAQIGPRLTQILTLSRQQKITTHEAAMRYALESLR
jgi:leucine dehydrogenase